MECRRRKPRNFVWNLVDSPLLDFTCNPSHSAMADDLIVVDELDEDQRIASTSASAAAAARSPSTSYSLRRASKTDYRALGDGDYVENSRTTRLSSLRARPQPKLKLKLSEKAAAQAPGMSFLGQYDRELDSDDEDLSFEEQFILRMPPGEDCERLRKMVSAREVSNDVYFKFKGMHTPYFDSNAGSERS